ncbi:MAG: MFS transporter [Gammaproteobacteria bacterium]|jgi:UMF1 family MFS transporter
MKVSKGLIVFSWSMYDFANTIFAMNVITLYFALWVAIDMRGEDLLYGSFLSFSMLLSAVTAPILGAISDRVGKRMPFLIFFTVLCCMFTALIGLINQLFVGLVLFALANYCFQTADIFYNSLLPQVSGAGKVGRVSGYGTGLGYCGTIAGLVLVSPFVIKFGRQAAFVPTGVLFLIFALPCFLFVKDNFISPKAQFTDGWWVIISKSFNKIKNTIVNFKNYPGLLNFLLAIFISFNAINTTFVFMSIYTKKVIGFGDVEIISFYVISSVFAIFGAFAAGFITDRLGAKRTLLGVLVLWCIALFVGAIAFNKMIFWIIGPMVGINLGSTWTSARALAVKLAPKEMVGEVFGFYGLMGKTASILGPLVWGISVYLFGFLGIIKYRIAVLILLGFLLLGLVVLWKGVKCQR